MFYIKIKLKRWILVLSVFLLKFLHLSDALTIDNQLVSARSDCFERIALEAMLPFEKAFRTEDTNSLKMCKEKCLQAGEKCQTLSFGVHRRGNGTCQLSSEKYGESAGRPSGVIFDPDFDLYIRKTNCFDLSDNGIEPMSSSPLSGIGGGAGGGDRNTNNAGVGGGTGSVDGYGILPTVQLPNRPVDHGSGGTPLLVVNPSPPTSGDTTLDDHGVTGSLAPPPTPGGDRLYFTHDVYPLYKYPMLYEHNYPAPNDDVYIPGGYAANVPEVDDHYRPIYGAADNNEDSSVRPTPHDPPRPIFGLGYGNGYSYGTPESYRPTTSRPGMEHNDRDRPSYAPRPGIYPSSERPSNYASDRPHSYASERPSTYPNDRPTSLYTNDRPTSGYPNDGPTSGYPNDRPSSGYPNEPPSSERPGKYPNDRPNIYASEAPDRQPMRPSYDNTLPPPTYGTRPYSNHDRDPRPDNTNRPDPPHGDGFNMGSSMHSPSSDGYGGGGIGGGGMTDRDGYVRRNGSASRPAGYDDDKMIATYFNPEDYMQGQKLRPMDYDRNTDRFGYPMDEMQTCFRRVLAGKRIAPHWVRRSISCERIEQCMRECGNEKRFMCEGFNYRLDPSGHGQGDCELIEIPLAQMDLYSSPNQRDSNLIRHPDYDYYERDRNAPTSCRRSICQDCSKGPLSSNPLYFKPSGGGSSSSSSSGGGSGWSDKPYGGDRYPPISSSSGSSSGSSGYGPSSTAIDHYHGPSGPPQPRPPASYEQRPPFSSHSSEYHSSQSGSYEFSSHGGSYFEHTPPSSYGSSSGSGGGGGRPDYIDRHDYIRPEPPRYRPARPDRWETLPSSSGYDSAGYRPRPDPASSDKYRPPFRPGPDYSPYRPHEPSPPRRPNPAFPSGPSHNYLDRDGPSSYKKPSKFVPYLIGGEENWGSYGGSYGGSHNKQTSYWGLNENHRRKDQHDFNYFDLGVPRREPPRESNSVLSYGSTNYGHQGSPTDFRDRIDYNQQWTRRPGQDECSAKTSEGFRLHKTAVKHAFTVPTLTECERLCSDQHGFSCHTFSYRYSQAGRENCMLCERPINMLDYYVDIEPDRDYDIYSMGDNMDICRRSDGPPSTALSDPRNAQCFFRAIDATRFFKSIVRDSLTVRSVGECEMECIRSTKFTCRAFAFRYGQQRHAGVIDNCQLSDWPVRDMDKERHLILDAAFDIFERASYGHGCEIQPIVDEKHKKLCYLGYGSPAKLLPPAIKKVISVPSEIECKKECIRFRETSSFKCYSFSYGSRTSSNFNCELSDLDQSELKLDVHYTHTKDRDYWLFAWNPFDWTCRDKVNTIGGSRVNNDRRMDIFREPGDVAWRHYTVTGKPCRRNSPCEKNLITGFYSCEIDGGEVGAWDYCCKVEHPCGYSRGFDYPWCFVGDEPDQWRKCSDRYFPGNKTHTSHAGITLPPAKSKKQQQTAASATSSEYQHPPRPGGLQSLSDFAAARLWPVTYLYSEGPPNATEFSNFVDCNKETC